MKFEREAAGPHGIPRRRRLPILLLMATIVATITTGRSAPAESVATLADMQILDVPQAVNGTFAIGVSGGNVVGGYYLQSNLNHGFLFNGNSFTPLDFPGSTTTTASGISGTNVAGFYTDPTNATHGFVYDGFHWSTLDDPNGNYTVAASVSADKVVGYFNDGTTIQGFLYDPAKSANPFTTLKDPTPGVKMTIAYGIEGSKIVGYFMADDHIHGFSYSDGLFTTLDFPGSRSTAAYGISGGNIVGDYQDADGIYHGFLYDGAEWTAINLAVDGATNTMAYGISGNQVVGEYVDTALVHHGFSALVAVPDPASVVLIVSGGLAGAVAIPWRLRLGRRRPR